LMKNERIGSWIVEYDTDATRLAFDDVASSGPEECACRGCKNWLMAREVVYPKEFLNLLKRLGIDPKKESEVYDIAVVPIKPNVHYYGGWFHFFGRVSRASDEMPETIPVNDTFSYAFHSSPAPGPNVFVNSIDSCRIEFNAEAPWVISDAEPRLEDMPRRRVDPKSD
jgi:hypothetical protein